MAKYVTFFSYTPDAWAKMIKNPSDRGAAVRALAAAIGGTVESIYFMFGEWDGIVVIDTSDTETAAAVAIAVTSTGAFSRLQTHQLIEPENLAAVLGKAGEVLGAYRAPGT
jgi:uncharacterized protein with GYD domain